MTTVATAVSEHPRSGDSLALADDGDQAKRSVDAMLRLYGFIVALALTVSTRNVFEPLFTGVLPPGTTAPDTTEYLLFTALLFTLIPFYHGANRHMDVAHIFSREMTKPRYVLVDFAMLFLESIILFCLALAVRDPIGFMHVLIALFVLDSFWAAIALAYTTDASRLTLKRWLVSNVLAAIVFFVLRVTAPIDSAPWWIASLAVIRTILDYWANAKYYFHRGLNDAAAVKAPSQPAEV